MSKIYHEFRDPVHVFIRLKAEEREVVDSCSFQRLRNIHQLATTYLVYPGATHKRFEHSLGVMELATRIYDRVTSEPIHNDIRKMFSDKLEGSELNKYWRRVLRMAALCHDIGHLPFSHAAEKDLFPPGYTHENMTVDIIKSDDMKKVFDNLEIPIKIEDIIKVAVGPNELPDEEFSDWETVLSEIITGDIFGADRMDYLLRDSHHTGVAYGKFDHYRLIDTLRILPKSEGDSIEPILGIESGGIHTAEALLLARYFMFEQLYFHPVRRAYDIHLKEFMIEWLGDKKFPDKPSKFIEISDNEILAEIAKAARKKTKKGHEHARRIMEREHFRVLWEKNPQDIGQNLQAGDSIYQAACQKYGKRYLRRDKYPGKDSNIDFPVLERDESISKSTEKSKALNSMPISSVDYVFISTELVDDSKKWLKENKGNIIKNESEEVE